MARDDEFSAFVAARYRALVRTAFLLVGDGGHAEDLAQSALIKTYLAWGRLRAPENADAYARRTMIRLAARSSGRRWHGEIPSGQLSDAVAARAANATRLGVAAAARSATATALTAAPVDLAIDVRRALAALPSGQREVLVLRYLDDLTEADTARILGISLGTVKSRAARGLAGLRRAGLLSIESDPA